jgi:Cu-Zn family superoxide dismutase
MITRTQSFALLVAAFAAVSCSPSSPAVQPAPSPSPTSPARSLPAPNVAQTTAVATIRDAAGRTVGNATLVDTYAGVLLTGSLTDLGLGSHGIHIHAVGKCEAPFTSAGGHFNPTGHQHGFRNASGPHLGDMPNVDTPASGTLQFETLIPGVTLKGQNALLDADGAAIVVHASKDDYTTEPAGNSGGRIACGVITQR